MKYLFKMHYSKINKTSGRKLIEYLEFWFQT